VRATDVDRDGDLDLLVVHEHAPSWFENTGPDANGNGVPDLEEGFVPVGPELDTGDTGEPDTDLPPDTDAPPVDERPSPGDEKGCGCASSTAGRAWAGLGVALLVLRRRGRGGPRPAAFRAVVPRG
jgi:hypothetical protein